MTIFCKNGTFRGARILFFFKREDDTTTGLATGVPVMASVVLFWEHNQLRPKNDTF